MLEFDKLGLSMTSYLDHTKLLMDGLLSTGVLSDVTLVSDDQVKIRAHKFMLMYYSPVFQNIFASDDSSGYSNSILYLRGIDHVDLKNILEFMYKGQATCDQERIPTFLKVARDLQIKEMNDNASEDEECNLEVEIETKNHNDYNEPEIQKDGLGYSDSVVSDQKGDYSEKEPEEFMKQVEEESTEETNPFKCPECNSVFKLIYSMQQHYKIKHKNIMLQCSYCDYKTSSSSHLYRHIRSIHEQIQHHCLHCDYKSTRKDCLNTHMKNKHSNQ